MQLQAATSVFCNMFAVWIALASYVGLFSPESFAWLGPVRTQRLLVMLSFSVGLTTKPEEFRACLGRPRPVALNMAACFVLMPVLAVALSAAFMLNQDLLAGMVLLGSVNGGSTSNLCALIAGADVPLSVLMTLSTTLCAAIATPLIPKLLLGAVVPVDAWGILVSAMEIVLLPVLLGVMAGAVAPPRFRAAVCPLIPVMGVGSGAVVIGAIVSQASGAVLDAGPPMHAAVASLHLLAGLLGYALAYLAGSDERECRTVAFEVAMKNCALASVLAASHFEVAAIRAPAAASCIWCPLLAAALAAFWQLHPVREEKPLGAEDGSWTAHYQGA